MSQRARGDGALAPAEVIAAWRASGAHRHDPVRFRHIEAMCRRAAAHQGSARRRLDERLSELIARYEARLAAPVPQRPDPLAERRGAVSPLKALLDELARAGSPRPGAELRAAGDAKPTGGEPPPELKVVREFKRTWMRLSADQRVTQALAKVPENAGPLNSNHLVHRALLLMRGISPDYLERFVGYVDALLWLDDLQRAAVVAKAMPGEAEKKPARARRA